MRPQARGPHWTRTLIDGSVTEVERGTALMGQAGSTMEDVVSATRA